MFIYLLSSTAYSGDTCSEDKNGCAEIECFRGVECLDIPAPGVGAICGACSIGFTGNGLKCSGIYVQPNVALYCCLLFPKMLTSVLLLMTPCVTNSVTTPLGAICAVVNLALYLPVQYVKVCT